MEDSDDHGAGIAKQKLCQRVASHIDGYSGPGACTLKFHAERDTWGLEHIVSRLAEQRQKKTATKRKLNNKGEATSITWKYGTGYGLNRKLKSKHKKQMMERMNDVVRPNRQAAGDVKKLQEIMGSVAQEFGWKAHDFISDKEMSSTRRAKTYMDRGMEIIKSIQGKKKPTASHLSAAGTFLASIAPGRNATDEEWASFSEDIGYKDCRKIQWINDAIAMRHNLDAYNAWNADKKNKDTRIPEGARVMTRYGSGTLLRWHQTGSLDVHMDASGMPVTYKSAGRKGARVRTLCPSIVYERDHSRQQAKKSLEMRKHRDVMSKWLIANNVQSPNKKDTRYKRRGWRQMEKQQAVYRFRSWDELWNDFKVDPSHSATVGYLKREIVSGDKGVERAPTLFIKARPWYLIKGKDQSCLCLKCEQLACKYRAQLKAARHIEKMLEAFSDLESEEAQVLQRIHSILNCPSKGDMVRAALGSCIKNGDEGSASSACEQGDCQTCGFQRLWSGEGGLRKKILEIIEDEDGQCQEELREACSPIWGEAMHWQHYTSRDKKLLGKANNEDDEEWKEETKNARNSVLETQHGNLVSEMFVIMFPGC
jgi:hypothetical protein